MPRLRRNVHQDTPEEPEKKKRKSHGPRKGGSFERDMCRFISLWWTDQERDDIFWRTSGSGARATVRTRKGQTTANSLGDLSVLDPIGEPFLQFFMVEMKRGYPKGFGLLDIIDRINNFSSEKKRKDHVIGWWEKLIKESNENNKNPLLLFRRDRSKPCVIISQETFNQFILLCGENTFSTLYYKTEIPFYQFVILRMEDFFNWVTPDKIKEAVNGKD